MPAIEKCPEGDLIRAVPSFKVANQAQADRIEVGDRVRSYDFEAHDDCYVDGVVLEITLPIEGCRRYRISVLHRVFAGQQRSAVQRDEIIPPVNGTRSLMGGYCNGVRRLDA